jgi:LPXTG-site transpeptidase (sortase) family protein
VTQNNWPQLPPKGWWVLFLRPLLRFSLSFTLIFGGLFLLLSQVLFPVFLSRSEDSLVTPLQEEILGVMAAGSPNPLDNITVAAPRLQSLPIKSGVLGETPSQFYLSVPRLGISQAVVETNSLNLSPDTALGHYRGTSLPGDLGTAFIYGHSTLPWFFNPNNYKTIFSTIPTLTTGDKFLVQVNNVAYQYEVASTIILDPIEVEPLRDYGEQINSSSSVVLMTCYPPGLSIKRFLAIGKLIF